MVTADRKAFDGFALWDNRGSEFTGEQGLALGTTANSFTPFGEQTELVLFAALDDEEQRVAQLTYEQQIGSDGLKLRGVASYGDSEPGASLEPLDVDQDTLLISVAAEYPYIRTRRLNFSVEGGFDFVEQESTAVGGATTLADDSLRVLFLTALLLFVVTFFFNSLAETVRHRLRKKFSRY